MKTLHIAALTIGLFSSVAACDDSENPTPTSSTFTTSTGPGAGGNGGNGGSGDGGNAGGGTGGDCTSAEGCWDCAPTQNVHFLNACTDAACSPFDNVARLPLYNGGDLPPIP
jgi:hypothetical protein